MLRYLCCKDCGFSSSTESVVEIVSGCPAWQVGEENATARRDEPVCETRRKEVLLTKDVQGSRLREKHGDLSCVSRSPWEVGRRGNVRDGSIIQAQGQRGNTGVSEAASDSAPKLVSLAREITINTPSAEDKTVVEEGHLGPPEEGAADMIDLRSRREIFPNQEDHQWKKRNLGVDNGSRIYEQTQHKPMPGVLSVTAERETKPNFLSVGTKTRGTRYQEEWTRGVDEGGECDLPSNNSKSPYGLNSQSINSETNEYHRGTPNYQNSHSINIDATDYHRGTPDYQNSHIINIDASEYHRGTPNYQNSHSINTEYHRGTQDYQNLHSINTDATEYHRVTPDYQNSHSINTDATEYHRLKTNYENSHNINTDATEYHRGTSDYQNSHSINTDSTEYYRGKPNYKNSHSINTEYHRGTQDYQNLHSINTDATEYHRKKTNYENSHNINTDATEYHRGTPDYQNSHSINIDTTEYHRGTPNYKNSHIINIDATEYHRGTPNYQNSHIIDTDATDYHRGTSDYQNSHIINSDATEYHRGRPNYQNSHSINSEYHRGTQDYQNLYSINTDTTEYHRGTPDYQNSHSINTDATEYHREKPNYKNSHSINTDATEYHRGTPDYQNSHSINTDTIEYHRGTPDYQNSHSININATEYHRGTIDYQNSYSINTDTNEYHRGTPDYQNSHSINIDATEHHRGKSFHQNSYNTTSDTNDYPLPLNIKSGYEYRSSQSGNQEGLHSRFDCENQPTCRKMSCLYNQTGFLSTVGNERYIWTHLGMATALVRTNITENEGVTVGCRLLWRGRVPVPISELQDLTEVQFDAVVFSQPKVFHALVIWQEVKPLLVIEPPPATYVFIVGLGVSVSRFKSLKETARVEVDYEGRTVISEVTKDSVFFNGKRASSSDMDLMSSFPPGQVFATVCKMMKGDAMGTVTYTFECVWYGKKPQADPLAADFKTGEVYMQEPRGRYIRDDKLQHLYCDMPATLKAHGQSSMLTFCMGKETIRVPVNLKLVHFRESRVVSLPSSDLPVKAHVVKCWGKSFWKVLMVQLLSRQDSVVAPHDSGVVSSGAPTSTVNSPGPSQPQESSDFGKIPVRSAPYSADGRGSLTPMMWVEGCLWNSASISQGIATLSNKSILIKQDRFYVDGVKVRGSEPLAKFFSKGASVNAVIEPQFRPIEVLGKTVTHRAIVAWLGTKPQGIDTFLESDLGEPFTRYDFPENSKPVKKTFVVERNLDCPTPATDKHGHGTANGTRKDIGPVEVSSDKMVSYAGSCNWKVAAISLGIVVAHAKKTIVVRSNTFFVNQVRVSGSDPLVRFTLNDTPVDAEVVAFSSANPVLGYTATHEALLAWQGERPLEAANIIADYIAGKPRENQSTGVTVHRTAYERSVFLKDIEERISSSCTTTDGSADGAIKNNVSGKLYKIGVDYGILRLHCKSIKEPKTLILFHPSVAYVDKKRLSSNKPLDQQLNLSNPKLWQCKIQECVAKIAEVTVQYKAILIWQGKKPSEEEITQQDSEPWLRAADESEWRDTSKKDHEKNSDKSAKAADASSEALHTPSTPSDEDDDDSRAQVWGKLTLLNAKSGRLQMHTGQYINFKRSQCLLYGIKLDNVQLHHVLRLGESVECRLRKDGGGVWQVEVLWAGEELLPLDPCFGYAQLQLWCRDRNVPSEDLATLLHEAGYDEGAAPPTASTIDQDSKSTNMTLSTAAVGNESDILHLNGEQWMSPDLFPTAGDERTIVEVDGKDSMSPDLYPTAAAGDEKCIAQLDENDWMSPDLFPLAAAGDEKDIVQLGWGF